MNSQAFNKSVSVILELLNLFSIQHPFQSFLRFLLRFFFSIILPDVEQTNLVVVQIMK